MIRITENQKGDLIIMDIEKSCKWSEEDDDKRPDKKKYTDILLLPLLLIGLAEAIAIFFWLC